MINSRAMPVPLLTHPGASPIPATQRSAATLPTPWPQADADDVIRYMRDRGVTLTYDPAAGTLQAGTCEAIKTIIRKAD
jgi:hypothetical protein